MKANTYNAVFFTENGFQPLTIPAKEIHNFSPECTFGRKRTGKKLISVEVLCIPTR